METKDTLSSCSNSEEQRMQQIQDKAKKSCMWHTKKILVRDPPPTAAEFSAEACDFLATHQALFRKFPEPFLCLVGISRYYDLDDNVYPTFLT
ncbi:hypothetical protein Tco_1040402, partial [Tanacetum coccineum]